mmetsp:Transcript_17946/g.41234  ORF Transcript_17946/g.41234 Transcript_17946/m.41234 type:complete len:399 (+) Transcript_17946:67-1263(+)
MQGSCSSPLLSGMAVCCWFLLFLFHLSPCASSSRDYHTARQLSQAAITALFTQHKRQLLNQSLLCEPKPQSFHVVEDTAMMGDAVVIDSRAPGKMALILLNMRSHLPTSFTVHAYTRSAKMTRESFKQLSWASAQLLAWMHVGSVRLHTLTIPISTKAQYNTFLASREFWDMFERRWLLLFELDSALCGNPTVGLETFLSAGVAFIGAAWKGRTIPRALQGEVGNSGLSLWRRDVVGSFLDEIEQDSQSPANSRTVIDGFMHAFLHQAFERHRLDGIKPHPAREFAMQFSVETDYTGNFTPFGVHAAGKLLMSSRGAQSLKTLLLRCPQAAFAYYDLDTLSSLEQDLMARLAVSGQQYQDSFGCREDTTQLPAEFHAFTPARRGAGRRDGPPQAAGRV